MATWTNIANTSLEPGSPARSVDAFALRDNPIAIAEGAAGAPRIQTNAIQDSAVTAVKLATGTNERDWVLARTAGAGAQAIGSYALSTRGVDTSWSSGQTFAASQLSGVSSGTWRAMGSSVLTGRDRFFVDDGGSGFTQIVNYSSGVFLRIS
jgi:hypothetical protein